MMRHRGADGKYHPGPGGSFHCELCDVNISSSGAAGVSSPPEAMEVCPVSGQPCTRNCENSPENPELAGLCERLGFAPMQAGAAAAERLFRKFHVAGWDRRSGEWTAPVEIRCWTCGVTAVIGSDDPGRADAVGLEELMDWARGHECGRMRVTDGGGGADGFEY